ncbi:hypothetical protein SAMN05421788_1011246 [Filimonas lacunae]|uniref:Uncharacterized protein n=1 Tax=Filimonas lacunae TaxID=477680 RepID=A0A1N7LZZ1_9BACT|nr:hypothetical protein SAMN05421788_1011246 [Filimonas lacunae]
MAVNVPFNTNKTQLCKQTGTLFVNYTPELKQGCHFWQYYRLLCLFIFLTIKQCNGIFSSGATGRNIECENN